MPYIAFYHPHAYFWVILVLFFFITYFLYIKNVFKGAKITHMVLRMMYVIIIGTGFTLLVLRGFPFQYIVKGLLGISLVYFMEMLLVKTKKGFAGNALRNYWILCVSTLVLILLMGYQFISF